MLLIYDTIYDNIVILTQVCFLMCLENTAFIYVTKVYGALVILKLWTTSLKKYIYCVKGCLMNVLFPPEELFVFSRNLNL